MRAAVLGSPVAHSLSPALHRAAYAWLGLGWTYEARRCEVAGLPLVMAEMRTDPTWRGASLTMPLKEVALALADEVDPLAARIGAANTLLRSRAGTLIGLNTDVAGIAAAVAEVGGSRGGPVAVLGAGGTARAALAALAADVEVVVHARDLRRAGALLELHPGARAVRLDELDPSAQPLVISTLPAGAADRLGSDWPVGTALVDVVYDPWPTALATRAQAAGAAVAGGLSVLVGQAVGQVRAMTRREVPAEVLRAAGAAALALRGR